MKRSHDLSGLIKFAGRPEWRDHLRDAVDDHLGRALDEFDLEHEELFELLGEHWTSVLWGCVIEDLATRTFDPDGHNLVDDYLARRGWNETSGNKAYMRALRQSAMSVHEVSDVRPGESFLARDLVLGGDPIRVLERTATKTLRQWDQIGARVLELGGRRALSGAVLSFPPEATDALLEGLRKAEGATRPDAPLSLDRGGLRELAHLITTAWLFDVAPNAAGLAPPPTVRNSDGDEVVFHRLHFPLAASAFPEAVAVLLDAVPDLQREGATFWNWLGSPAPAGTLRSKATGGLAYGVSLEDGTPVLGNVELDERGVVLSVTSAERARRGRALMEKALGSRVGAPLTSIETIEQALESRRETPASPGADVAPEMATPLVHDLLDRQYRATLDQPVGMLDDATPREAARSENGRARVAQWLKYLENRAGSAGPTDPMATYDFGWIWLELNIEDLRR